VVCVILLISTVQGLTKKVVDIVVVGYIVDRSCLSSYFNLGSFNMELIVLQ